MEHLTSIIDAVIDPVPYQRDPVSELFDRGAAGLLRRAYARPGRWAATRIRPPSARHLAWAVAQGIWLDGPDPVPGGAARSRWARAFVRSAYHLNTWYVRDGVLTDEKRMAKNSQAIRFEVGRLGYARGLGVGWPVRLKVVPGGGEGYARIPAGQAYTRDDAVRSVTEERDWAAQ